MSVALTRQWLMVEQDRQTAETVERNFARLRRFIRSRVPDSGDAEDILQEVFYELIVAYRAMEPIEQVTAWLFRVARNRITDLFRKRRFETEIGAEIRSEDEELLLLEDFLPSPDAGPEAAYARSVLLDELAAALEELPGEQRDVFIAHEIEGYSFKEIAARTGTGLNTLLSRKRYAVVHLRQRLQEIYDEFVGT
jgi:RNA polymerase sigma factor (sigma-70 family)